MTDRLAAAMHENYTVGLRRVSALGGNLAASARVGPWQLVDAGLGEGSFNIGVLVEPSSDPDGDLALAEGWFASRGLWFVRLDFRSDADADMLAAASRAGFVEWWRQPAMLLHPLPSGWPGVPLIEVRDVRTREQVEAYVALDEDEKDRDFQARMVRAASQLDGFRLLLGLEKGEPVARSMAVVTGDMVGIYNVFVPPALRNHGYGAAITVAAIEAGRKLGATAACLESTDLGLPVYRRLGFVELYEYITMQRPGAPVPD